MIIFLYGEDTFRSRQKLKELKEKFLRDVDSSGNSITVIDGETATVGAVREAVGAVSLFSSKRMIIIEKLLRNKSKKTQEEIRDYFKEAKSKKEKDDNIIIFWDDLAAKDAGKNKLFEFLKKEKYSQDFKLLSNTEVTSWVRKEIEKRDAKIKPQAALGLAGMFGGDLWQLNNEIDKLINYKQGENKDSVIDEEDVEKLARGKTDANIFALTDAISNKNKALALQLFEKEIGAGISESHLIFMIIRQFRILLQIKQCLEKGYSSKKIISQLKLHPFIVQKGMSQAANFSFDVLKSIFRKLVEIDKKIKTGQASVREELSLLISKI